jgi:peptidoglycan/LPS O-acetylase OafA/YrhL
VNSDKVYFKGLNGLRIIAALLVFFSHVEYVKQLIGLDNLFAIHIFKVAGASGVDLFFCISGFLITFLLIAEKERLNSIALKDFYIRRILRIWPLYYFVLLITLFVIPQFVNFPGLHLEDHINLTGFLLFVFFSPYIAKVLFSINFLAAVLWSVGVEETYYLIWPNVIKYISNIRFRHFVYMFLLFTGIKAVVTYIPYKIADPHLILKDISSIMEQLRIECMIIGGACAFLLKKKSPLIRHLQGNYSFGLALLLLTIYFVWGFKPAYFNLNPIIEYMCDPVIYALLCSILILNVISRKGIYSLLERRVPFELGQISYGFYVYHSICIMFSVMLFRQMHLPQSLSWLIGISAFLLTTLVAYISYYGFEQRFLKLKKNFTHIVSGREAKTVST